jgi:hypothetical protein
MVNLMVQRLIKQGDALNADVALTIACYRYYAGWADKNHGKTIPIRGNYMCYKVVLKKCQEKDHQK